MHAVWCVCERKNVQAAAHVPLHYIYPRSIFCVVGGSRAKAKSGAVLGSLYFLYMYQVNRVCVCKQAAQNSNSVDTQPALLMLFIATKSGFV